MTVQSNIFEMHPNWRATATLDKGSEKLFVMQGAPGDRANNFYLYPEDWLSKPMLPPGTPETALEPHSASQIQAMFESGRLTLVKGSIPKPA